MQAIPDPTDAVTMDRHGAVALLWLDRPGTINAIDGAMLAGLNTAMDAIEAAGDIGAVVLAGRGARGFCSGADLGTIGQLSGAEKRAFIALAWRTCDRLGQLPVPTVACLHGHVLGGGLELALACDLRLADPGARMGLPEMALGSVPSFGAVQRLPGLIGGARALELLLCGARIEAAEAQRIGLVTRLSAPGAALPEALALAEGLTRRSRDQMRFLRMALAQPQGRDAGLLHGVISDLCHRDAGYQERIRRFGRDQPAGSDPPASHGG